jgi:hypothetical protein
MGWLFTRGSTRKDLIEERSKDWERTSGEVQVKTTCLAHCYRGGNFSDVLWAVWERTFIGGEQRTERWITCDLLRYQKDYGWGYKDMDESMFPYYFSCPLGYLDKVPLEQYGGHAEWREGVRRYHAQQAEKRKQRCSV